MSEIYCKECGKQVAAEATVCPFCGVELNQEAAPAAPERSDRDWLTTFLLCWFLGDFGVHSFYAKKTGIGVAQLLTCGGCGIWTLIDWVTILLGKYQDGEGKLVSRK